MPQNHHARRSIASAAALIGLCVVIWPGTALAYRPFDGTDAAVADPNEVEIEFQPLGAMKQGSDKNLIAPAAVFNIGLQNQWEAVFQGNGVVPLSPTGPFEISDPGIFIKHVIRSGSLQDQTGPSIATELGVPLPEVNGDNGIGVSLAGIVSQRWDWGTLHFNVQISRTRDQNTDVFTGLIVEGPGKWQVRPVAEIFYEEDVNQSRTFSGLVGLIWQVRDNLSFDAAFRHAVTDGRPINEIRFGTTFGFTVGPMAAAHR
jgi:hypothetical protein